MALQMNGIEMIREWNAGCMQIRTSHTKLKQLNSMVYVSISIRVDFTKWTWLGCSSCQICNQPSLLLLEIVECRLILNAADLKTALKIKFIPDHPMERSLTSNALLYRFNKCFCFIFFFVLLKMWKRSFYFASI